MTVKDGRLEIHGTAASEGFERAVTAFVGAREPAVVAHLHAREKRERTRWHNVPV